MRGAGFKIQDSRFKIQDSRFKVQSSKFKVQSSKGLLACPLILAGASDPRGYRGKDFSL
jgi:hypothetical protein